MSIAIAIFTFDNYAQNMSDMEEAMFYRIFLVSLT